eukprot:scaffold315188_cov36-Prasinocladus_malaysianus.AAC.1
MPDNARDDESFAQRLKAGADIRLEAWGGDKHIKRGVYDPNTFLRTILVWEPRAINRFVKPLLLVTLLAIACAVAVKFNGTLADVSLRADPFTMPYSLLLTVIGFLQVFRLNRAAIRYWEARAAWGRIIAALRNFAGLVCTHCNHCRPARDDAIAWSLAFAVASKARLNAFDHMPLYAIGSARAALLIAMGPQEDNTAAMAIHRATAFREMEQQLHAMSDLTGLMERIKSTPLPLVYVTHLRTSMMVYLLLMPFLFASSLGWGLIPTVALVAFFLLGVEGAATECESPFNRTHWNHLRMEAACSFAFHNVQEIVQAADEIRSRAQRLTPGL